MDDKDFQILMREIEKVTQALSLEVKAIRESVDLKNENISRWQSEQDRRLQDTEILADELDRKILNLKSQIDIAETRQIENNNQQKESVKRVDDRISHAEVNFSGLSQAVRDMKTEMVSTETKRNDYVEQNDESIKRIYNRINKSEEMLNELDNILKDLIAKVNVIEAKQIEFRDQSLDVKDDTEDFRKSLSSKQDFNKGLWIPIVFSTIVALFVVVLEIIFK